MWEDRQSMKRTVGGERRLDDTLDDAILTLGVRMHNPLSYQEIASMLGITHEDVSDVCEPYKEFLRAAGQDGPGLVYTGRSARQTVLPGAMWQNAVFGNSGRESIRMQQLLSGADRLGDPVDDAILTLGVRMRNPLAYQEIASALGMARAEVRKICEPYKEFVRKAGEYGIPGVA